MGTNEITAGRPPFVAVAILMDGSHHELTQEVYNHFLDAADNDAIVPDPEKMGFFRKSGVTEILSLEDYKKLHPEKHPESGRQVPLEYNGNKAFSIVSIAQQFKWASDAFNFANMEGLVLKVWDKMDQVESEQGFKNFCVKHHALTPEGAVITGRVVDKQGREHFVAFAFPLFNEIWKAIAAGRRKAGWMAEKGFEGMEIESPNEAIAHIENLAKGLKLTNPKHPLLSDMRNKARQIKALAAVVDKKS